MKQFVCCLIVMAGLTTVNAQDSVCWELSYDSIKGEIHAAVTLPQGWYAYLDTDSTTGIAGPQLMPAHPGLVLKGQPQVQTKTTRIKDPLFDHKFQDISIGTSLQLTQQIERKSNAAASVLMTLKMYTGSPGNFQPFEQTKELKLPGEENTVQATLKIPGLDASHPLNDCGQQTTGEPPKSLLEIFLLGLVGGFAALLTPCVFPMIPVTVSFFTNRSKDRATAMANGGLYGVFIFLIYLGCSLPFHLVAGIRPEIFNNISTNVWLNLTFFVIFTLFALSFFGLFNIGIPSAIATRMDSKSSFSSIGGIFFMALTLTIVSFSCTGVILGSLLAGTAAQGAWPLTAGMAGFGVALGLPFALFAMFPGWLKHLPKSGGWLDTVKKVLAFVELALALKFLSNADLVAHWGILRREVFIALWLLITLGLAVFLLKPLFTKRLQEPLVTGRTILGFAVLGFAAFLLPALGTGGAKRLAWLSGFPPPASYSVYHQQSSGNRVEPDVINDYNKALELSRKTGKPILLDFTGWACVNCRKMEENVWAKPEISSYIKEHYILLSLYVDDRKALPEQEQQMIRNETGALSVLKTHGDKWAGFETANFGIASQPLYAVINSNQQLLNKPVGYTPDADLYLDWLRCGIQQQKQ